jgi:hypothetical protein
MRHSFAYALLLLTISFIGLSTHSEVQAQALSTTDLQQLQGEWTLEKTLNKEGLELPMPDGPRDRFDFVSHSVLKVYKKAVSADAKYKVDLSSGELYIGDRASGRTIKYIIQSVDDKRLELFYPDEIKGSKTLIFSR